MSTSQLITHLLHLFAYNHYDRHLLLAYYTRQQPGMPHNWYPFNVRYLIHAFPQAMRHCLTALQHGRYAGNVCP